MEDLNACAQCGFTTQNFAEFIEHVDEHEVEHQRQQQPDWHGVGDDESVGSPPSSSSPILKSPKPVAKAKARQSRKTMHSCPHCNFTTYMSQHMKSHLEAHSRHQGQMYQCDVCQMQFSQKANMHRHRMRHSGVKPYQCRYCLKRFFRKDQMQEHSMTHIKTGADFDCPVASCDMQFSQHAALRSHLEEFHTIAPNSPASCKRCALLFANARRLLLHYQTKHDTDDMGAASPASATSSSRSSRKKALDSPSMVHIVTSQDRDSPFQTSSSTPALPVLAGDSHGSEDGAHNAMLEDSHNQSLMDCKTETADQTDQQFWAAQLAAAATEEVASNSPSLDGCSSATDGMADMVKPRKECLSCGLVFLDPTLYFLHKGLHSESDPWKCNLCGHECQDKYQFHTHLISADHS